MDNPRPEKVAVVDEVRERLRSSTAVILTEYRGLKVKDISTLRRALEAAGGEYKVYKNTLVRFAVNDLDLAALEPLLVGPTAIAFVSPGSDGKAGDAVAVARTLRDYARTNPALVVKGGVLGTSVMSAADAAALADIPPREVLLARLAGGLAAPLQQLAGLLGAIPRNFAYGLKALLDKGGTGPTDVAPAAAPPPAEAAAAEPVPATEAPGPGPVPTEDAPAQAPPAEAPAAAGPAAAGETGEGAAGSADADDAPPMPETTTVNDQTPDQE